MQKLNSQPLIMGISLKVYQPQMINFSKDLSSWIKMTIWTDLVLIMNKYQSIGHIELDHKTVIWGMVHLLWMEIMGIPLTMVLILWEDQLIKSLLHNWITRLLLLKPEEVILQCKNPMITLNCHQRDIRTWLSMKEMYSPKT